MAQVAYLCEGMADTALAVPSDVLAPTLSLFGKSDVLDRLAEEARRAGLFIQGAWPLGDSGEGQAHPLGDICVVDCRSLDAAGMAALIRLDQRASRAGAEVLVLTSADSLDDAFGCVERAAAQFLVDPRPGEYLVALGHALARLPGRRVRELDEADRMAMLRLTHEVGRLAARLDRLALPLDGERGESLTGRLASPGIGYRGNDDRDLMRKPRAPLPDPRLVHQIIRQRRLRDRYFESGLFADPAWDILLDLTAARAEHRRVSVTSLCIAAAVPPTTALRWVTQMTEMGLLVREHDPEDRRRAFIVLADPVADAMARYFDELGREAAKLV
ncbi:MAG: winged helix DNA-binding protein [Altererythrobacter sp.]|nr:winged helix DNA-binding protein [Altererythrobacter sp.]